MLYEQAEGIGEVTRDIRIPDKITGQPRQVDVLIELGTKGHEIRFLIDAKFYSDKIDVRQVEEVLALAEAVKANKAIIVTANGWTGPAKTRADFSAMDLRLLTIDEALDLVVPDKWCLCPHCENDCIVADAEFFNEIDEPFSIAVAGQCRECRHALVWCWDCGMKGWLSPNEEFDCGCGHEWLARDDGIFVRRNGSQ